MLKITKYVLYDILKGRVMIAFTAFLFLVTFSLFSLEEDASKGLISLLSIIMIIVPLVSIVFSTTYFYNSYEFIELLIAQPLKRSSIIVGQYLGVVLSMSLAMILGIGIPIMLFAPTSTGASLLVSAIGLTCSFTSLAFLVSVSARDKARGIGISLMLWFYFSVIYDALVLGILFSFSDYPLDTAVIALASLNPIDLGRIIILLKLDISALMGFTGAIYKQFFGSIVGICYTGFMMLLWILIPFFLSIRIFKKKNI